MSKKLNCFACKADFVGHGRTKYCLKCYPLVLELQKICNKLIIKAIKFNKLKHVTDYLCVDCGNRSVVYDHRDYTRPLAVVPVCKSCNCRRGPADVFTGTGVSYSLCNKKKQSKLIFSKIVSSDNLT